MAIVVESVSAVASATSNNLVVTKPTGVAVGDLLVVVLHGADVDLGSVAGVQWNTLATWTQAIERVGVAGDSFASIQYRVATSTDVSASNYTFTATQSETLRGYMLRCSGRNLDNTEVVGIASATTVSYTPPVDGSLAVLSTFGSGSPIAISGTVTGFSTNGVTYTQAFQSFYGDGTPGGVLASAYGVQTTAAAITTFGASYSFTTSTIQNLIVVFIPPVNATGTNTLVTTTSEAFAQTGTADTVGTNTLVTTNSEAFAQSGAATSPQSVRYSNQADTMGKRS